MSSDSLKKTLTRRYLFLYLFFFKFQVNPVGLVDDKSHPFSRVCTASGDN